MLSNVISKNKSLIWPGSLKFLLSDPLNVYRNNAEHDEFIVNKVKEIQKSCDDDKTKSEKYNELINLLENPQTISNFELSDLIEYKNAFNR
jgi:hypothetical protein